MGEGRGKGGPNKNKGGTEKVRRVHRIRGSEDNGSGGKGKRGVRLPRGGKGAREVAVMTGRRKGG